MFTGLIETIGKVVEAAPRRGVHRLVIASSLPVSRMADGESVSVDGVCLTVASREKDRLAFDAVRETLARTTLGTLRPGGRVHLERALSLGSRLGGHLVQGHVDAVAGVLGVVRRSGDWRLRVAMSAEIARFVALKGSVAVAGVSLTVAELDSRSFGIALIPSTLERTKLGDLAPGDRVNVEVDLLARYLERWIGESGRPIAGRGTSVGGRGRRNGSR